MIKTYAAGKNNKVSSISHQYAKAGQHGIYISGNAASIQFINDSILSQARLYTSISFGSNITSLPDRCCYEFTSLRSISFSRGKLREIGNESFYGCIALQSLTISDPIKKIGKNAFYGCTSLAVVSFPSYSIEVGEQAFSNSGIKSLQISSKEAGDKAFYSCVSLVAATIDGALGNEMLASCIALQSATIKTSSTSFPKGMFSGCTSLQSISFSNLSNLDSLGDYALNGCRSLVRLNGADIASTIDLQGTKLSYVGEALFSSMQAATLILPATIKSPAQLNPLFLSGSSISTVKFMGMTRQYIVDHANEFTGFGKTKDSVKFVSYEGEELKPIDEGGSGSVVPANRTAFVISVGVSENIRSAPLPGMYLDTERFIKCIDSAYSSESELILGIKRLNDESVPDSVLGSVSNLDAAFDEAEASGAEILLFHFSDHGNRAGGSHDGSLSMYGGPYSYSRLYEQFNRFKYVFCMLCCCFPKSNIRDFSPTTGKNTRLLMWCAGSSSQETYMIPGIGHCFMTALEKTFKPSYTWEQQCNELDYKSKRTGDGTVRFYYSYRNRYFQAHKYNYNNFPEQYKVFRIG